MTPMQIRCSRCVQRVGGRLRFCRRMGVAEGPDLHLLNSKNPSVLSNSAMSFFPEKNLCGC